MNIQTCICLSFFLFLGVSGIAQQYNTAAGLRIGGAGGITLVQRIADHGSIEAFAVSGFNNDEFTVTVLGRRHVPLISKQLNMFVGAGFHKGWGYVDEDEKGNPFGIDGQVGIEFNIKRATLAYDLLPQVNLTGNVFPFALRQSVSVRYILYQRKPDLLFKFPWEDEAKQKERLKNKRERLKEKKKRQKQRAKDGKSKWKMPWEDDETYHEPSGNWIDL